MSDRITVINNDDGTMDIVVNGENTAEIPSGNLDPNIHAIQWYGDHGEVEYNNRNEEITDFSPFNQLLLDRDAEIDRIVKEALEEEPKEPSEDEVVRGERNILLEDTDWIILRYLDQGDEVPLEWKEYRQALRDIPEQEGFPGSVDWPEMPEF